MGVWSKVALVAASAAAGAVINRFAGSPEARRQLSTSVRRAGTDLQLRRPTAAVERFQGLSRRWGDFVLRVKEGMDEREADLKRQFGVRAPVDHTADHHAGPDAPGTATTLEGSPPRPGPAIVPTVPSSEGNIR